MNASCFYCLNKICRNSFLKLTLFNSLLLLLFIFVTPTGQLCQLIHISLASGVRQGFVFAASHMPETFIALL